MARCSPTRSSPRESRPRPVSQAESTTSRASRSRLCLRLQRLQRGGGVRGWGPDGPGTERRGGGARARRALMLTRRFDTMPGQEAKDMNRRRLNRREFTRLCATSLCSAGAILAASSGAAAQTAAPGAAPSTGRTVKFRDGTIVPALGQGSARLGKGRHPQAAEEEALRAGLSLGMTVIDTAEIYGSEDLVGRAIAGQRDRAFLVSKVC